MINTTAIVYQVNYSPCLLAAKIKGAKVITVPGAVLAINKNMGRQL